MGDEIRMKRSFSPRQVIITLVAAMLLTILACSEKIVNQGPAVNTQIRVKTDLAPARSPALVQDLFKLTITGPDMDTIRGALYAGDTAGVLVGQAPIPIGLDRHFTIEWQRQTCYLVRPGCDTSAVLARGEATTDVVPGASLNLVIHLVPVVPMIRTAPRFVKATQGVQFEVDVEAYNIDSLAGISGYLMTQTVVGASFVNVDSLVQPPDVNSSLTLIRDGNFFGYLQSPNSAFWVPVFASGNSGTLVKAMLTVPVDTVVSIPVDTFNVSVQLSNMYKLNGDSIPLTSVYLEGGLLEVHR